MGLEEKLQKVAEEGGDPWDAMSMGAGRSLEPVFNAAGQQIGGTIFNDCPHSPDGFHHFIAVSNVQSVEKFKCRYCPSYHYD